ncbi:MAG: hypothetical protein WD066_18175 [Planctomycetaceae bacterium]
MAAKSALPAGASPVRQVLVPVEHLSEFLEQSPDRWHVMDADEFRKRLSAADRSPPAGEAPRFASAVYQAEFIGDAFAAGTLLAELSSAVTASSETPQLMWLDSSNLALSALSWSDHSAIWGADREGRTAVLIDRAGERLAGAWSLNGRKLPGSVEFEIHIPRATVSRFELAIPDSHALRTSSAEVVVSGPHRGSRPGWSAWRVDAGSRTDFHLSVVREARSARMHPVVLARVDTSYVLRSDGLEFQCDFNLDVAGGAVGQLRFALPAAAEVLSIEYRSSRRRIGGGLAVEDALAWTASVRDGMRLIDVALPDAVLGPMPRPVRIRGFAPPRLGRKWMLPRPRLVAAENYDLLFLEGRSTLEVEKPLEVRGLSSPGARQIGTESDGRSFTFQRFRTNDPREDGPGGLIVDADHPEPVLSARTLTAVLFDAENWTARTRIEWRASSGSTFAARCGIPPGWQIAEVRPAESARQSAVAGWDVVPEEDGSAELRIEFRDALVPAGRADEPGKAIVVVAQRLPVAAGEPFPVPGLRPLDCEVTESIAGLSHSGELRLRDARRSESIRFQALPEPVRDASFWRDVVDRDDATLWLRAVGTPDGTLMFPVAGARNVVGVSGGEPVPGAAIPVDVANEERTPSAAPSSARHAAGWAGLSLASRLAADSFEFDDHRAVFRIPPDSTETTFVFRLPEGAELTGLDVNGTKHSSSGEAPLEPGRPNVVTLDYRTRSSDGWTARTHDIPTPRTSLAVLAFDWTIALPPGIRCAEEPKFVALDARFPRQAWTVRLFGPLGRPAHQSFFNPFLPSSWSGLFGDAGTRSDGPAPLGTPRASDEDRSADIAFAPAGWRVIEAWAPYLPERLVLRTQQEGRVAFVAWTLFLGTCLMGIAIRLARLPRRSSLAVVAIATALAAAIAAPPAWTSFAGGIFAGCVLSALTPIGLFRRIGRPRPVEQGMTGSTATFQHASAMTLAIVAGGFGLACVVSSTVAQEAAPSPAIADPRPAFEDQAVLVPVDPEGAPADLSVVYVNDALRDRLARAPGLASESPRYLIARADYLARIEDRDAVTLDARYDVIVLPGVRTAEVEFPLAAANPGGPDACLVAGEPVPVVPLAGGKAFTVAIARPDLDDLAAPWRVEIAFALHPPPTAVPGFDIEIPPVAASRAVLSFSVPPPAVSVPPARGRVSIDDESRTVTADLGGAGRLRATWFAGREASSAPAVVETSVLCDVDVRPAWIEYRYRIAYRAPDDPIDYLAWNVPRSMLFRGATIDGVPAAAEQSPRDEDRAEVLLTLPAPRAGEFVVEATFFAAVVERADTIAVPLGQLLSAATDRAGKPLIPYRVGVRTAPEFRLTAGERGPAATPIAAESFPVETTPGGGSRRPQFAFDLRGPAVVRFALEPLVAVRRVRQFQAGRVGREQLAWKLLAEVEVAGAPAYRHTLVADPRLRIRSISVEEADVERLVHWSREGDRLHLFLDRGTTATQRVALSADLPLDFSAETTLPDLHFEGAEIVESRLELVRDPEVTVDLLAGATTEGVAAAATFPEMARPDDVAIGKFSRTEAAPPVRLRALVNERPRVDTLTMLGDPTKSAPGALEYSIVSRFPAPAAGTAPYRLHVPPSLAADHRITAVNCLIGPPVERPDGAIERSIQSQPGSAGETSVEVSGAIATTAAETWLLPRAEVLDAAPGEHFLLLPPAMEWLPADGSASAHDEAPDWVIARDDAGLSSESLLFRGPTPSWNLERRPTAAEAGPLQVSAVWTRVWQRGAEREHGTTIAELPPRQQGRLRWRWPADCVPSAAFIDGEGVAFDPPGGNELVLPVAVGTRTVALFWTRSAAAAPAVMRRVSDAYPLPREAAVENVYLSIVPDRDIHLMPRLRTGLVTEQVPPPTFATVPEALRPEPRSASFPMIGEPAVEGRIAEKSRAQAAPASFWAIRATAADAIAAAALFLLVVVLAWRPAPAMANWLAAHPAAAWALVGFIWWWWLGPAIVGVVILLSSLWLAIRRRPRGSQPETAPGT